MGVWVVAQVQYVQYRRPYMAPTSERNDYKPTFAFAKSSHLVGGLGLGICTQMVQ